MNEPPTTSSPEQPTAPAPLTPPAPPSSPAPPSASSLTPSAASLEPSTELDPSGLPPLPAFARLKGGLAALAQTLPGDFATLLAAPRFATGAAALARLADPAHREAALQSLAPTELEWFASELARRTESLARLRLPPAVALLAPCEVHVGDRAERVSVQLCAAGITPDWTARWHGAEAAPDGASAVVTVPPPASTEPSPVSVRVHVHARGVADGVRCALVAEALIRVRAG